MIHLATDQGSPAEPMHKSIEVQGKTLEFAYTEGSNVFARISLEWMLLLVGEIELLRKLNATAAPESGWRPIETAPKDGRTVLLGYFNSHGKWRTMRGQWMSEAYIAEYWEEPDNGREGWFETSAEADDVPNCWAASPTHWQHLPAAPTAATGEAVKQCPNCKGTFSPTALDRAWQGRCECTALATPPAAIPAGFALVPLRMTRAMQEAVDSEGWQWAELLAAACAVDEAQYEAALIDEPVGDAETAALIFKLECFIDSATGGKLSKSSWSLETLRAAAEEHIKERIDEALEEEAHAQQEATEPMFYASQQQAEALQDPPGENERGVYLPLRKTSAGMFTMPLYCALAPEPQEASAAARDVLAERRRQVKAEGWTREHDDEREDGSLARAAACYALGHASLRAPHAADMILWPWELASWKPTHGRRDLVRSGALILAEIERLDRAALQAAQGPDGEA